MRPGWRAGGCAGSRRSAFPLAGGSCSLAFDEPGGQGCRQQPQCPPDLSPGSPAGTCDPWPQGAERNSPEKGVDENLFYFY